MENTTASTENALSPRQEAFCQNVAAGKSLAESARRAGYSLSACKQQGHRMMTNADICLRIEKLQQEQSGKQQAEIENAMKTLDKIINWGNASSYISSQAPEFRLVLKALEMKMKLLGITSTANSNLAILNTVASLLPDDTTEKETAEGV